MTRIATVSCLLAFCIAMAAQSEPSLIAVNMPTYPLLARQARIAGVVRLTFVLLGNDGEGHTPASKLQVAYEKADASIQQVIDLLAA